MRLNGQFGYVYKNAPTKTTAHELGHGIFKLEHPTASNTKLLMDYSESEILSHKDWQQIGDPAFKFYGFQDQSEGELAGGYGLSPNFDFIKTDDGFITDYNEVHLDQGFIEGFVHNGKYFYWNKTDYVTKSGEPYKDYVTSLEKNAIIWLAYNHDQDCSEFKFIRTNYSEIESIINNKDKSALIAYIQKIDKIKRPDNPKNGDIYSAYFGCGDKKKRSIEDEESANGNSGGIKKQLNSLEKQFGENVEYTEKGKVYRKGKNGEVEEVEKPLTDNQINTGDWQGNEEQRIRTTTDSIGVVQIQAFGINPKNVKIVTGKTVVFQMCW